MKAEVDKLEIAKLVNVLTNLNKLKAKANDLFVGKLKIAPIDLKKLSTVVDKQVVRKHKIQYTKDNYKNNNKNNNKNIPEQYNKNIPDATTLIHTNQ